MCYTPFHIKKESGGVVPVPCGRCPECRKRRLNGWAFRIAQEEKMCNSAYFITLTYDTNHIPITGRGALSLQKRDVQLFFKRLRKKSGVAGDGRGIKYYAVGEYGTKTVRPHYHILLFNAKLEFISDAWRKGKVHYGEVNNASIRYTIDYMSKPKIVPYYDGDDRVPEFSLMSKGLGAGYLSERMIKWHRDDLFERMYVNIEDGKKVAMPRYYKERVYKWYERNMINEIMMRKQDKIILRCENLDVDFHYNMMEMKKRDFRIMGSKSKKILV